MKDKKTVLIQPIIGAVILIIGIVLCVNTYIVKGNKAYAFSLLVTILGIVILIAGLYRTFSKKERKLVDAKVIAQAALCAALCYVGATFIKIDIPVGTERTMFHFGNVFCVLAALLIGGEWGVDRFPLRRERMDVALHETDSGSTMATKKKTDCRSSLSHREG